MWEVILGSNRSSAGNNSVAAERLRPELLRGCRFGDVLVHESEHRLDDLVVPQYASQRLERGLEICAFFEPVPQPRADAPLETGALAPLFGASRPKVVGLEQGFAVNLYTGGLEGVRESGLGGGDAVFDLVDGAAGGVQSRIGFHFLEAHLDAREPGICTEEAVVSRSDAGLMADAKARVLAVSSCGCPERGGVSDVVDGGERFAISVFSFGSEIGVRSEECSELRHDLLHGGVDGLDFVVLH